MRCVRWPSTCAGRAVTAVAAASVVLLAAATPSPRDARVPAADGPARAVEILERQLLRESRALLRQEDPDAIAAWLRARLEGAALSPDDLAPLLQRRLDRDATRDLRLRAGILAIGPTPVPMPRDQSGELLRSLPAIPENPASDPAIVGILPARGSTAVVNPRRHPRLARDLAALPDRLEAAEALLGQSIALRQWIRASISQGDPQTAPAALLLLELDEAASLVRSGWDVARAKARVTAAVRVAASTLDAPTRERLATLLEAQPAGSRRVVLRSETLADDRLQVELRTASIRSQDWRRWAEGLRSP